MIQHINSPKLQRGLKARGNSYGFMNVQIEVMPQDGREESRREVLPGFLRKLNRW